MDGIILYYFIFTYFSISIMKKKRHAKFSNFKIEQDIFLLLFPFSLVGFMFNFIFNINAIVFWLAMTLIFTIFVTHQSALTRAYCLAVVVESIILNIHGYVFYEDNVTFLLFILSIALCSHLFIKTWDKLMPPVP